ncbi:hypothetical protein [Mycobacterium riyadhense]
MPARVSPTDRVRAKIDELFASDRELPEILEEVARLGAQLLMQALRCRGHRVNVWCSSVRPSPAVGRPRDVIRESPNLPTRFTANTADPHRLQLP